MAVSPAVAIGWIPEDDLLLKNAVEGGASLEALAKGAVKFSRRFTLRELHIRWYSLLYDPEISGQSSSKMFELEISGFNSSSKLIRSENTLKGNKETPLKRKLETIRRKYYTMRKKIHSEIFSSSVIGCFDPHPHEFNVHGAQFQKQVTLHGNAMGQTSIHKDCISDELRLQEEDLDILRHAFPETVRELALDTGMTYVSDTGGPNSSGHKFANDIIESSGFDEDASSSFPCGRDSMLEENIRCIKGPVTLKNCPRDDNTQNSSVGFEGLQFKSSKSNVCSFRKTIDASEKPHLRHLRVQDILDSPVAIALSLGDTDEAAGDILPDDADEQENRSAGYTVEYGDPDSLLNLSNEDEILLIDADETHAEEISCSNNIAAVDLGPHTDCQANSVAMADIEAIISFTPFTARPVALEVITSSSRGEEQTNLQAEVNVSSSSTSNSCFTELSNGKIRCVLNTEDTEIPCNDDIFLLIHPSTSFGSYASPLDIKDSVDAFSAAHGKNSERISNFPNQSKYSMKAFGGPLKVGVHQFPEPQSIHSHSDLIGKTEILDSRPNLLSGFSYKTYKDSSKGGLLHTIPSTSSDWLNENEVDGVAMRVGDGSEAVPEMLESTGAVSGRIFVPESAFDASGSDQEESLTDVDVPYFSDVEAMILEMDLYPYDHDSLITTQGPSYMCDDSKRTIIRLEQGARSCLQRVMTAEGALAILYGRYLRHYIRKPEVVLGRSTEDVNVDIDLRKEGWANKISRRQAIIKMETDGSFILKNIGKSSLSVNGMEVSTGQLLNLSSSCLIEIREMSFVFEINQRYVKQYLVNLNGKKKEGRIKAEQLS